MNGARTALFIARADFLERVRRYSFLVVLAAAFFACYQVYVGHIALIVSGVRGTMNSAWMGALMSLTGSALLGYCGFYVVNNSLALDQRTRLDQILAATPLTKSQYIAGKALSNFALLAVIVVVLMGVSIPLQLAAGEDRAIHPLVLFGPFVLVNGAGCRARGPLFVNSLAARSMGQRTLLLSVHVHPDWRLYSSAPGLH